jgi:hypothetical protein
MELAANERQRLSHVQAMDAYPDGKRPFLTHLFSAVRTRSVLTDKF